VEISTGKAYSKNLGDFRNATVPAAITLDMLSNFTDVSAAAWLGWKGWDAATVRAAAAACRLHLAACTCAGARLTRLTTYYVVVQ
jgi:hypothetical protein